MLFFQQYAVFTAHTAATSKKKSARIHRKIELKPQGASERRLQHVTNGESKDGVGSFSDGDSRMDERGRFRSIRRAAEYEERRVADLYRRLEGHTLLTARSNRRLQFQQARNRVAVQDRQSRSVPRVQIGRDAAHGEG